MGLTNGKQIKFTRIDNIQLRKTSFKKLPQKLTKGNTLICLTYSFSPITKKWPCIVPHEHKLVPISFWWIGNIFVWSPYWFSKYLVQLNIDSKANTPTTNIILPGFNYKHMPTKSAHKVLYFFLYIKKDKNYKLRPDLNINKKRKIGIK